MGGQRGCTVDREKTAAAHLTETSGALSGLYIPDLSLDVGHPGKG